METNTIPTPRDKQLWSERLTSGNGGRMLFVSVAALLLFLLLRLLSVRNSEDAEKAAAARPLTGVYVLLDPGHGGRDKGTVQGDVTEAALNYRFAAVLARTLRHYGAQVFFTAISATLAETTNENAPLVRPTDARHRYNNTPMTERPDRSPTELYQRGAVSQILLKQLPRDVQADPRRVYFLSLHHDEISDPYIRGGRILMDARDGRISDIARAVAVALGPPGIPLRLRAEQYGVLNPTHNRIREKILIELATVSNPDDLELAQNPRWQQQNAERIAQALLACRLTQTPKAAFVIDVNRKTFTTKPNEDDFLPGAVSATKPADKAL